jgi:hypothetical protein
VSRDACPTHFTPAQAAQFRRGHDARTSAVLSRRTDLDTHAAEPPYRTRTACEAWRAGWHAAKSAEVPRA